MSPAGAATAGPKLTSWSSTSELTKGTRAGVTVSRGTLKLSGTRTSGTWTSPWTSAPKSKTLIPSWNAATMPKGTWLDIAVRARSGSTTTSWKKVARWRYALAGGKRMSYGTQRDALVQMNTDTLTARSGKTFSAWQIKVTLRRNSTATSPVVSAVRGVAAPYATRSMATSTTTMTRTIDLAVPTYSQMIHRGHHPQWGGGGEAWCSPTSTAMVLKFWGRGPKPANYTWNTGADGMVDHAARFTYDSTYRGTGNWPFNTAYASLYKTNAVVTRLRDLRDVEKSIKAGIPVIVSVAFGKGKLTGSPISSTPGHLMVVRGFTKSGAVIANDPAGATNKAVKRTYRRDQFEKAWLGGSGGVVYLITPAT